MVTGSNGKSTTCKILEYLLNKNKINAVLGGNIGKPVLSINLKKKPLVIIEASSFQLAYSKFIKPNYAILTNISKDHIDWHGSLSKYIKAKLKIFANQNSKDYALINSKKIFKKYKEKNYSGKTIIVNIRNFEKIKKN